jgi:hypothetical protein
MDGAGTKASLVPLCVLRKEVEAMTNATNCPVCGSTVIGDQTERIVAFIEAATPVLDVDGEALAMLRLIGWQDPPDGSWDGWKFAANLQDMAKMEYARLSAQDGVQK